MADMRLMMDERLMAIGRLMADVYLTMAARHPLGRGYIRFPEMPRETVLPI